jgi:hypothetical protein
METILVILAVMLLISLGSNIRAAKKLKSHKLYNERMFMQALTLKLANRLTTARLTAKNRVTKTEYSDIVKAVATKGGADLRYMPEVLKEFELIQHELKQ